MDVISSIAAVSQLLCQAIELWQQVQTTYERVKARPKLLLDANAQLSNLLQILSRIEREPKLRTDEIDTQLKFIKNIAIELCERLKIMAALQRRSAFRQSMRAWSHGSRDEAKLAHILNRLEQAKTELTIHINVVHVGLTKDIADEVGRLAQAPETGNRSPIEEVKANQQLLIEGNTTSEVADQLNGIIAIEAREWPTFATVRNNKALQQSRQKNIIAGGTRGLKAVASSVRRLIGLLPPLPRRRLEVVLAV
ncbi:hypothetical protein NUW58_g1663 [Xylaria curta]|uniref:Uncharacterized protein n=1 Tax=Xylaria curta TaxID=42375 RepID=A0ACC1PJ98_9PEZI|nr:hypothetical protein NUW58_g1663 [Xylaria curta]